MNFYEILPLKKTGPESRTFTYGFEGKLALGSLVQVPLRNRSVRGLVIEAVDKPTYQTREITKVLSEEPILNEVQISIARKISDYFLCTLGETINAFLPFDVGKKRHLLDRSEVRGDGLGAKKIEPNAEQRKIIEAIGQAKPGTVHLLHGVTGSGKTEIYLQLTATALAEGKSVIILVPEIALTPQTRARFEERFGDSVAVWHSNLKETEKFDTWEKIRNGEKRVILGARSAILMPAQELAYVFIDEEHEQSYKQDQSPRYDARTVSEWLIGETGAKLVLGSATPRVESYFRAKRNEYNFYSLNKRIVQDSMPPVKIVDLRDEFRKGNKSIISDALQESIAETLTAKKQVMLLLNRRGAASFVFCRDCGYTEVCPNCELPLTYHPSEGQVLKCHHCDYHRSTPAICPECQSVAIRYYGLGTQRAELEVQKLFPGAKIVRMDRDTTQKRGSHEEIYHNFRDEKFDILIGTQMIAKGWDLPNVELVGVISADTMLNLPDFRSSEKTFSLLTQVAGRTGRGYHPGRVIIQTYNPENFAILAASKHNYEKLYEREIEAREKYEYPPFARLIRLNYSHPDVNKAEREAVRVSRELQEKLPNITILGPSTAFIEKMAGKYRYQIIMKISKLKTNNPKTLEITKFLKENLGPGWTVDVDCENLL
jgi:primosomal protein N' (replication factor Y)